MSTKIQTDRIGWVYLIHAEGTNRYKIGRSANLVQRTAEIQRQSPFPLKIIHSFQSPDAFNDELVLHEKLGDYRVFGEWFEFDICEETTLSFINQYFYSHTLRQLAERYVVHDWLQIVISYQLTPADRNNIGSKLPELVMTFKKGLITLVEEFVIEMLNLNRLELGVSSLLQVSLLLQRHKPISFYTFINGVLCGCLATAEGLQSAHSRTIAKLEL